MRLCFECSEYPPGPHGDVGSLVQMLARGLVEAGHEVRAVGLYSVSYTHLDVYKRQPTGTLQEFIKRQSSEMPNDTSTEVLRTAATIPTPGGLVIE